MWSPALHRNKVWSFGVYCEERRLNPTRVLKLVQDNYYLTDITTSSNGSLEEDGLGKISTLTTSISHNGYEASTESQAAPNGNSLLPTRNYDNTVSFKIPNRGIDHEMSVELQQEDDGKEEEEEKVKLKKEEIEVSSPMLEKPKMRPYSVTSELMFTRKEIKSSRRKMCLIALAILLAVLLIGGIAAVLIVFVGNVGASEPEPVPVAIQGEFRIANMAYSDAYSNPQSAEYMRLQQEFIREMDSIYSNSTFKDLYINTEVSGFREGSVVVAFVVQLKRLENENTDTNDNTDNDAVDPTIYVDARDFILVSTVDNGMLGQIEGTVINLTLIPGKGKPTETITIPPATPAKPTTAHRTTTMMTTPMPSTTDTMQDTTVATTSMTTTEAATTETTSTAATTTETITTGPTTDDPEGSSNSDSDYPSLFRSSIVSASPVIRPCDPDPCLNGATCVYYRGAFCQCPNGYYGTFCERDVPPDPCEPSPCLNEGNCTAFLTSALCTCPDDYYGHYCQYDNFLMSSSSYSSAYDSMITPFPSMFPLPGGDMFDCESITIQECLDVLPYNKTTSPNPHGMGINMADIQAQYESLSMYINTDCHQDGTRVLCSLLHTRCTGETTSLFMAFLNTYIPCKSLCLEVCQACGNGNLYDFDDLCNALPESADSSICYRSPTATGPDSCSVGYCMNGGSCFVIMNETICRCVDGFIGQRCEIEAVDPCLSNPCENNGECQTEVAQIPGIPLLYICICQIGYFGQHCEHKDMSVIDVDSLTAEGECGAEILIPECADLVPYNISYSSPIIGPQWAMVDWTRIIEDAMQCHQQAAVFVCSRIQRKCTYEGPILPCRALCERVQTTCNIASFALPEMDCATYSDSLNELDCFDITY